MDVEVEKKEADVEQIQEELPIDQKLAMGVEVEQKEAKVDVEQQPEEMPLHQELAMDVEVEQNQELPLDQELALEVDVEQNQEQIPTMQVTEVEPESVTAVDLVLRQLSDGVCVTSEVLMKLLARDLQTICQMRGLSTKGIKSQLTQRVIDSI